MVAPDKSRSHLIGDFDLCIEAFLSSLRSQDIAMKDYG